MLTRVVVIAALLILFMSFGAIAYAQTTGTNPPGSLGGIIVVATMVLQWLGSWAASRSWSIKARKLIPTINMVISTASQMLASFAAGLGPAPAVVPTAAVAVVHAGIFATFGNIFLDVFLNSLMQTAMVTGGHSMVKNTVEAHRLGKS